VTAADRRPPRARRRDRRLKVIRHRDGKRRIVILARPDGRFTFIEEVRRDVTIDPETREVVDWPEEPGLRLDTMRLELDGIGLPTGVAWFHRIALDGIYDTAERAEEDALQSLAGYRTLH
jgi:hypothetical protein